MAAVMPEDVADPAAGTDLYTAAALPDPKGTVTFFIPTFVLHNKVDMNFLYTYKVYTGQSLYEDKVYKGQSPYGDKVYTRTKFTQFFFKLS
jgi:hypothetical protein